MKYYFDSQLLNALHTNSALTFGTPRAKCFTTLWSNSHTQNHVTSRVKNCLNDIHLTKLIFYTKIHTFSKLILGNKILGRLGTKFGPELSSPNKVQALFPLPSFRFRFWLFCVVYRLRLELILRSPSEQAPLEVPHKINSYNWVIAF